MRNVNEDITITERQTVTRLVNVVKQDFSYINENKTSGFIEVGILHIDANDEVVKEERVMIEGSEFILLMSSNPEFAPGKPQNEYREEDLWHIVDLIRNIE